jgi:hypothetical protein
VELAFENQVLAVNGIQTKTDNDIVELDGRISRRAAENEQAAGHIKILFDRMGSMEGRVAELEKERLGHLSFIRRLERDLRDANRAREMLQERVFHLEGSSEEGDEDEELMEEDRSSSGLSYQTPPVAHDSSCYFTRYNIPAGEDPFGGACSCGADNRATSFGSEGEEETAVEESSSSSLPALESASPIPVPSRLPTPTPSPGPVVSGQRAVRTLGRPRIHPYRRPLVSIGNRYGIGFVPSADTVEVAEDPADLGEPAPISSFGWGNYLDDRITLTRDWVFDHQREL